MKTVKIGINGVGRIGRTILRAYFDRIAKNTDTNIEVVAVNNPGIPKPYVHLLKHDSLHGKLEGDFAFNEETAEISYNGRKIKFFSQRNPEELDWSSLGVNVVIDCTGIFKDKAKLGLHMKGTVKKVIMCAPGKDLDGTFVMGINHEKYDSSKHHIISNASCTTNCLAPIVKVLHENFGIVNGLMTTVHAYTSDQNLLDNAHDDLRRARAAALSMIPTSTGAAKALGEVIPEMIGKLDGYAVRVPTPDVSMVDLTVNLEKKATKQEINDAMKKASQGQLKGILGFTDEELVSMDFMGTTESSFFDSKLTNVIGNTAKVVSWYDNEVGFSNRVLDLANFVGQKL
ncbi:type I glyceraldehyde-3-phosphate dehydrogenase [Peredibacter sp. HCB2-198]|uniref:type I glyceraldehyde-3-phosphate dehydrogenase n=1 Tax=Peredibacter sp. HCB2-198 TaxID=3383025 RepID=UPI0038B5BBBC